MKDKDMKEGISMQEISGVDNVSFTHIVPENDKDSAVTVENNLKKVKENINLACREAGRGTGDVKLIAVSKIKPVSLVERAVKAGQLEFGENKPQELKEKKEIFGGNSDVKWHMIGSLQKNKVKYVVGNAVLIHSVDSYDLACEIDRVSFKKGMVSNILIEINIADEPSKSGIAKEEALNLVSRISSDLKSVHVCGLMCIAPETDDPESSRKYFVQMRKIAIDIKEKSIDNVSMDELSMGMSSDYRVAIEEGATLVRVGTAIFGPRNYQKV